MTDNKTKNWETVGAPDELEKVKAHRNYLCAERDGWFNLFIEFEARARRWCLVSVILFPLSLCGLFEIGAFIYHHIKVI